MKSLVLLLTVFFASQSSAQSPARDSAWEILDNLEVDRDFEIQLYDESSTFELFSVPRENEAINIKEFYRTRGRYMTFWINNMLPVTTPRIYATNFKCQFKYVDIFGKLIGSENLTLIDKIWPGDSKGIKATLNKCVVAFDCDFQVCLDDPSYAECKDFNDYKFDIRDVSRESCIMNVYKDLKQ